MGLDMYLNAERYFWYNEEEPKHAVQAVLGEAPGKVKSVRCEALYWRKANEIHQWFVDHVQNGKDERQESYVSREQLQELLSTIEQVLENRELAPELLPTASGFFFGSTEYDEGYWEDLTDTKEKLTALLSKDWKGWEFYYRASW